MKNHFLPDPPDHQKSHFAKPPLPLRCMTSLMNSPYSKDRDSSLPLYKLGRKESQGDCGLPAYDASDHELTSDAFCLVSLALYSIHRPVICWLTTFELWNHKFFCLDQNDFGSTAQKWPVHANKCYKILIRGCTFITLEKKMAVLEPPPSPSLDNVRKWPPPRFLML